MSYNVSFEKAVKLVGCIRPNITYVNGIFGNRSEDLAEAFKLDGFNVISLQLVYSKIEASVSDKSSDDIHASVVRVVRSFISRFEGSVPMVIVGFIRNTKLIDDIFSDKLFTYAYMYPNNAKRYRERVLTNSSQIKASFNFPRTVLSDEEVVGLEDGNSSVNSSIKKLLKINSEIYKEHLEVFENRILTVLT